MMRKSTTRLANNNLWSVTGTMPAWHTLSWKSPSNNYNIGLSTLNRQSTETSKKHSMKLLLLMVK